MLPGECDKTYGLQRRVTRVISAGYAGGAGYQSGFTKIDFPEKSLTAIFPNLFKNSRLIGEQHQRLAVSFP